MMQNYRLPALLVILDGFGLDAPSQYNAISRAHTPCLDELFSQASWTRLEASGEAVGLPAGQMGNSEVGHLNIGAGRIVHQELSRINRACEDGSLLKNKILQAAFKRAMQKSSALHLMGLLSFGGVHSNQRHLYALINAAIASGVEDIYLHCFMDGRDVPPTSGVECIEDLNRFLANDLGGSAQVRIASMMGRYYAMDRDNRWERVERAYDTLVSSMPYTQHSPSDVLRASYEAGVTDEFIEPVAFEQRGIQDGDALIFFNFRPDRARQLSHAFVDEDFEGFTRKVWPKTTFVCLTEYDTELDVPVVFPKEYPEQVLADVLADRGLKQLHIAETEKYAHVTFFLNGGREEPKKGEQRILIPSPKVATYDLQPEMSAPEVATRLAQAIKTDEADVYIVNFANCDMVGHTGSLDAAIKAVEAVDAALSEVLGVLKDKGGLGLLIADHGNADKMCSESGDPHTAHTTAPVPCVLLNYTNEVLALSPESGSLCDVAVTLLACMGIEPPKEMTGRNLLATS